MNLSLFSLNPAESGYRLHRMEVWNWGTFDDKIYAIEPGGENSLLTGANGSGKTTFVHALLTLLAAERRMRSFNMSAEGKTKNERTEESYVLGEYANIEEEGAGQTAQRLRPERNEVRSTLLAVFKSEDHFVTLAQVRWFSGMELRKTFVLAHKNLTIETDFRYFDTQGEWKKRLRQQYPKHGNREMVEIFDGPREYSARLRTIFGMRSEKAQSLFNQTISLKILGNLDEFIRTQMLEETDMEDDFERLKDHFKTLSEAHRNIEKTLAQIELLQPVRKHYNDWRNLQGEKFILEQHHDTLPAWFASYQKRLLEVEIKRLNEEREKAQKRIAEIEQVVEEENEQLLEVETQLRTSEPGRMLAELEKELKRLEEEKALRQQAANRYAVFAEKIGWDAQVNEKIFEKNLKKADDKSDELKRDLDERLTAKVRTSDAITALDKEREWLEAEIEQLKTQRNNITGRISQIRQEILEHTGATEAEIPFVGELIQVANGEGKWEYAIEKLLHAFALRLLVPEDYYKMVNKYVQNTDLRGRIVYERYRESNYLAALLPLEKDTVPDKVDIRTESPYADWVDFMLRKYYNHLCTDNLNEFARTDFAITSTGLIKNGTKHEKDDRSQNKKKDYVLGWDNTLKLRLLIAELNDLEDKSVGLHKELSIMRTRIQALEDQLRALDEMRRYRHFSELDWEGTVARIDVKERERAKLEKGDPTLQELQQKKERLQKRLKDLGAKKEEKIREEEGLKRLLEQARLKIMQSDELLAKYEGVKLDEKLAEFQRIYIVKIDYTIDLDVMDKVRKTIHDLIRKRMDELSTMVQKSREKMQTAISRFKYPTDEKLRQRFPDWNGDTHRLPDSVDLAGEYMDLLEKLEGEELKEQQERFKKYLNEEMITRMSSFGTKLGDHKQQIQRRIEELNQSLSGIHYRPNPHTYIQLDARDEFTPNIRDFRQRLISWKPNLAEYHRTKDDSILEASYLKIKELIEDLDTKEGWRKEVMDVRRWLRFIAREVRAEDKSTYRSYTGTEKLSGGEQAQLTYTILGSAIAYQFGITADGLSQRSFRFICVDEAFSRQDEEKARYLMNLCKQLNLQIMVVSPDKTEEFRIVEPFIARVHYVQRRGNRDSLLYDMPIKQLKEILADVKKNTAPGLD